MRSSVLFATCLLVSIALTGAAEENAQSCDNHDFVVAHFGLSGIPDEELADVMAPIEARLGGLCLEALISGAEEDHGFPIVGDHLLVFEFVRLYPVDDLMCNNVEYAYFQPAGGPGGHYDAAEELSEEWAGRMPWSYGEEEYVGAASSTFSDAENALGTIAYVLDLETGEAFSYNEPIRYEGVSDFFCQHWEMGFIHDFWVFNTPFVSGAVHQGVGPLPLGP